MRKNVLLLIFFFFLFSFFSSRVLAASPCTSITITPPASSGPFLTNQVFTLAGTGCPRNFRLNVIGGPQGQNPTINWQTMTNENGEFSIPLQNVTALPGTYEFVVMNVVSSDISGPIVLTFSKTVDAKCGDTVPANYRYCPASCPSVVSASNSNVWVCPTPYPTPTPQPTGQCGKDLYNGKLTFCSLVQIFNNGTAPYGGCGFGQQCFIGDSAGLKGCNWVVDSDGLKFCFGGFNSRDEVRSTKVEFRCANNCGGANIINATSGVGAFMSGKVVQTHSNASVPDKLIGYSEKSYFSCVSIGGFDQSVIEATRYQINAISAACGIAGLGEFIALSATGAKLVAGAGGIISKLTLPVRLNVSGTITGAITSACLAAINNYHPEIETKVTYPNGTVACQRYLTIGVASDGTITSTDDRYGGPTPGTVLQYGRGGVPYQIKTCTPNGEEQGTGVETAIGCIPTSVTGAFVKVFQLLLGIAGGLAFLLIILGGLQIIFSQGNPERLGAGQEIITSAIVGLILIIFSILILRIVGVDILAIPGFGGK